MVAIKTLFVATLIIAFTILTAVASTSNAGTLSDSETISDVITSNDTTTSLDTAGEQALASMPVTTASIMVVPEPATIMVLGLSSLALLRTRRGR